MKKKLIIDITPLKLGYFQDGSRGGIYFTVKNILLELLRQDDVVLYFNIIREQSDDYFKTLAVLKQEFPQYADSILSKTFSNSGVFSRIFDFLFAFTEKYKRTFGGRAVRKIARLCSFLSHSSKWDIPENIAENALFLSLMYPIPAHVKKMIPPSKRCTMLYDVIQSLLPECFPQLAAWYAGIIKGLSSRENYLTISRSSCNDFKRLFPEIASNDIKVVYLAAAEYFHKVHNENVIKNVREKYGIPSDKKIFLTHCSLSKHKNLPRLFAAFCKIRKNLPDWILVFSGSNVGSGMRPILEYARKEGIPQEAFLSIGYVEDRDLPVLYSMADLFCFVSLYEGFGLPVLEALSCGAPCLVSKTSSLPEVASEAAIYVDPLNTDDIAKKMLYAAQHEELRKELADKGLEQAKNFSWHLCGQKILEYVKNIY